MTGRRRSLSTTESEQGQASPQQEEPLTDHTSGIRASRPAHTDERSEMSITSSKCERLKVVAGGKGDSMDGLQDERGGVAVSKPRPPLRRASAPEREVLRLVRATVAQHRACMPLRNMFALYRLGIAPREACASHARRGT